MKKYDKTNFKIDISNNRNIISTLWVFSIVSEIPYNYFNNFRSIPYNINFSRVFQII